MSLAFELAGRPDSPAKARRAVHALEDRLDHETLARLRLLLSEVVAAGVRDGAATLPVRIEARAGGVSVRVGGGPLPRRSGAAPRSQPRRWAELLLDRLSSGWGVEPRGWAWFEVDRHGNGAGGD